MYPLFRWWPAQIVSERCVPDTLKSKPTKCMFLVRFFATGQYFWTHHGRVISFTEECTAIKEEKRTSVSFKQQSIYKEGKYCKEFHLFFYFMEWQNHTKSAKVMQLFLASMLYVCYEHSKREHATWNIE